MSAGPDSNCGGTMTPLKIAIDATALLPKPSGVDTYILQLVRHLGQLDYDNHYKIFVNCEDRKLFRGALPVNFTVVPFCLRPRLCRLAFQQIALPVTASRWGADVIHSPSFIMPMYRGRPRHVVTVHDMTSFSLPGHHRWLRRSTLYRHAVLQSINRCDAILAPSDATRQAVQEIIPDVAPRKIHVTPLGVGTQFHPYPSEDVEAAKTRLQLPASYILYVGTIEPRKNLMRLAEAYQQLVASRGSGEHLVLAGQLGWGYQELLTRLQTPQLRGRVHLPGYVAQSDLPYVYAGARLFVYPSIMEGFGLPPLEAMACGVPTVSSLSSSLVENLEGAAELIHPEDIHSLIEAMRRLLQDNSLRAKRRQLGLERAAQFSWRETARRTLDCYRAVGSGLISERRT